eukprot:scaffold375_cov189-Skeletonema_marinoi.AAC.1
MSKQRQGDSSALLDSANFRAYDGAAQTHDPTQAPSSDPTSPPTLKPTTRRMCQQLNQLKRLLPIHLLWQCIHN